MLSVITRFAPSPTGHLHIGNARTALICYLYARQKSGKFILRLDDTDTERSREEYSESIKNDLNWLGFKPDEIFKQSERLKKYEDAKERLIASGRIYPCYETQQELDIKRKMQMKRGHPPIYDRASLNLTSEKKAEYEAQGKKPHYRFLLKDGAIKWDDQVRGEVSFEAKNLSDPILIREDGTFTYMLPSTVDDADMNISHVVRGEDHLTNTAIQIQIFEALGAKVPVFAHLSLLKVKDGKISKREGGFEIAGLREQGIEPMAINSFLAKIGTSEPVEAKESLDILVKEFNIKTFSRAPTIYEVAELERLNTKIIHHLPFRAVQAIHPNITENFWLSVRPNLKKVEEVKDWWIICHEEIKPEIEDIEFTSTASNLLPEGSWDQNTWEKWMKAVQEKTGRKGKMLFMPIRKALTGMEHGPELKNLLPLMERDKVIARLNGKAA